MIEHLDGIHETVTYKENSSLRLFVNTDCEDYPIHWHTPMEIIMPLEGTYTVFLGDKPVLLQEGDIIFICPGILHSLVAPENGKRIILQIEWSVVSKIRDLNSILALISPVLTLTPQTAPDIYSDIYHLICQILSEYEEDSFLSEAVIYARMLDILSLIGRYQAFASCRFDAGPQKQKEYLDRFLSICNYIDEHCTEDLSLDQVAKNQQASANTTLPDCLSSLQIPPITNTFNRKRIDHAMLLLSDPRYSCHGSSTSVWFLQSFHLSSRLPFCQTMYAYGIPRYVYLSGKIAEKSLIPAATGKSMQSLHGFCFPFH